MGDSWQWPASLSATGLLAFLFGVLRLKRKKNSDAVLDSMDTISTVYVSGVIKNWQDADKLAKANYELYIIELRRADALQQIVVRLQADMAEMQKQVERLTRIVIGDHPEFKAVLRRTGFGEFDDANGPTT